VTRAFLLGVIASMRAILPIAIVSNTARQRSLPRDNGVLTFLAHPAISNGAAVLAAGELLGDKLPAAPNRTSFPGIAARAVTGALTAAALAPADRRRTAAVVGGMVAVAAAYLTLAVRRRAAQRFGQVSTGIVEDAIALGGALWLLNGPTRRSGRPFGRAQ
jgi:uncharacterized membrane protein